VSPQAQIQRTDSVSDKEIRCVIVHDHVLLRQGLRRLLEDEPDLGVVSEAENAAEALQRVFEHRPDVVIADTEAFGLPLREAENLILKESPHSKILFLSSHEPKNFLPGPAHGQSVACAERKTSAEEIVEMVRRACRESRTSVREMPRKSFGEWHPSDGLLPRKRLLTMREREVLKLLAEGKTVRSAASILGLSVKTVDAHKFNLMRKLAIHNKAELVMWAIQKRVVKIPANF
jgi:two-component system, NarL family, response regulator NreC